MLSVWVHCEINVNLSESNLKTVSAIHWPSMALSSVSNDISTETSTINTLLLFSDYLELHGCAKLHACAKNTTLEIFKNVCPCTDNSFEYFLMA